MEKGERNSAGVVPAEQEETRWKEVMGWLI